jgi:tetratricopeptide (TPR) repeat protein
MDRTKADSAGHNLGLGISLRTRITSLVGFGGEGKSSLAREWVDELLADGSLPQPDGIFWWGFYEGRNVDEFFNEALAYLSGGKIDPTRIPSSNQKAQIIGAMLGAGRFLFVLDGLEVLQHQEGDMYGSILSPDLKAFLELFASPDHSSFCLVTSRVPLMDLEEYTTYRHRDVERLLPLDGRDLLRKLGVQGDDDELDRVVADWGGHALTLSLLASYLKDHHGGDVKQVRNIPPPTSDEPRYERVHRVLRRYDDHLDDAEKAFLMLFSAFRRPVDRDAFRIFRAKPAKGGRTINDPIVALNDSQFEAMVKRLVDYRILRHEPGSGQYTTHPLIRAHYFTRLTRSQGQAEEAHKQIKEYYLAKAQGMPDNPSLDELTPLIEVVYHACQCGAYDEAESIRWERIDRRTEYYITKKLGAWETQLEIMQEFFLGHDASQEPLVSSSGDKAWILNEMGLCLANTGRGNLADRFYERGLAINIESKDWAEASTKYRNISNLYCYRGDLARGLQAAGQALDLARRAGSANFEIHSLARQAWAYHLLGDLAKASQHFRDAECLEKEINPSLSHLYGQRGIQHADHLRCRGEAGYARKVTQANLDISERYHVPHDMSRCHRVLADLFVDSGQQEKARESYGHALELARSVSHKLVLIEALLGRGRWYAKIMKDPVAAFSDLTEALEYARAGGYRLYEADIRIGLAWAHLAAGD